MLSDLPKILGKEFVVGYFLPVCAFLFAISGLLVALDLQTLLARLSTKDKILDAGLATLIAWLLSVGLAAMNREIIRFLEGYGKSNPFRLLRCWQRSRYRRLRYRSLIAKRQRKDLEARGEALPATLKHEIIETNQRLATHFPHDEAFLLPTALGNAIRAFETYSFVIYGVDSIGSWTRLLSVVPKDFQSLIEAAKARLDFWVNLVVLSALFIGLFTFLAMFAGDLQTKSELAEESRPTWQNLLWCPAAAIALAWLAIRRAIAAAIQWGECVKATFDVFLPELVDKLGYDKAKVTGSARTFWHDINVAFNYRQAKDMTRYQKNAAPNKMINSRRPRRKVNRRIRICGSPRRRK